MPQVLLLQEMFSGQNNDRYMFDLSRRCIRDKVCMIARRGYPSCQRAGILVSFSTKNKESGIV